MKKARQACCRAFRGTTGIRTWDTRIFNPLLYQLSYSTELGCEDKANLEYRCEVVSEYFLSEVDGR